MNDTLTPQQESTTPSLPQLPLNPDGSYNLRGLLTPEERFMLWQPLEEDVEAFDQEDITGEQTAAKPCKGCGTVSKLKECPFCHTTRGKI